MTDDLTTRPITSAADLLAVYAAGRRDFSGADLGGADLDGADLRGAYLDGADLDGANLDGAYLDGANLRGANLDGANLRGAYLRGAYLDGANVRGANLRGAYLGGAYLDGADLDGANLDGAYLDGAYLDGANLRGAKNIPTSSHDAIAELLRQAAGARYDRRQVAGLVLVSRDWCWSEFRRVALAHWPLELRRWIVATLSAAGEQFVEAFAEYPVLTAEEQANERSGGDGA